MTAVNGNLVLTGMMGVGKTTVGRWLAHATGRAFVDTDELVAARTGHAVADLFATGGEAAFRAEEAAAVMTLAGTEGTVIATGGLTLADPASRSLLESLGPVMVLTARPATLSARLAGAPRPTLPVPDEASVAALLSTRRALYDSFAIHVATDDRPPEEVGAVALGLENTPPALRSIPIKSPAGGYRIVLGRGSLGRVGDLIGAALAPMRAFVVTEPVVAAHHLGAIARVEAAANGQADRRRLFPPGRSALITLESGELCASPVVKATIARIPSGEAAKDLDVVRALYEAMAAARLERGDVVIALGGGAVGDTAGFAASTYLRGVRLVHIPTTLLAMVDSSVGGKTGVDLAGAKNAVGSFYDPSLVLADPDVLASLAPAALADGYAEILKAAIVGDPGLFELLEQSAPPLTPEALTEVVERAIRVKAAIVERDPRDEGERIALNLGHTFAHAIETVSGFGVSHGQAVAVGLLAACRLGERIAGTDPSLALRVGRVLERFGLPTSIDADPRAILEAMVSDKKRRGGRFRFVVPIDIGRVAVREVPQEVSPSIFSFAENA